MIDPDHRQVEFHRLSESMRFERVALERGVFNSTALPGFRLEVEWLWNAPLAQLHAIDAL